MTGKGFDNIFAECEDKMSNQQKRMLKALFKGGCTDFSTLRERGGKVV